MCRRFKDGLNKDIKVFVGILELKEFIVLVDWDCKAEELIKEKRKAEDETRNLKKGPTSSAFPPQSRKSRNLYSRSHVSARHSYGNFSRGRSSRNAGNKASSKNVVRDSAFKSEARAPAKALARAYAIRAREDASSPNVITDIFSLYDLNVIALIDPGRRGCNDDWRVVESSSNGVSAPYSSVEGLTFEFQFVAKGSKFQGIFDSIVSRGKKVKKEELHFKAKVKDMEPNHEKEEKMTKSVEKENSKHKEDKGLKHKEKDKEKHEDSEIGEMKNKEEKKENKEKMYKDEKGDENTEKKKEKDKEVEMKKEGNHEDKKVVKE
ncbi:nucleolar protein 58-like [Gossypium hirsutum]|uniref:Nucleolar protein 58-like n=1 Tax=Gossypium hirsutum TaxID=3635 RepID=A0ABM2ZVD6_GOSHI|nr:nucleolar protein 58-like [Gossypium hirsutum]